MAEVCTEYSARSSEIGIYVLDPDAETAAAMLCDQHLSPTIDFVARVLCTVSRIRREEAVMRLSEGTLDDGRPLDRDTSFQIERLMDFEEPIESDLDDDPWAKWILCGSIIGIPEVANCCWMFKYGKALLAEYSLRFEEPHPVSTAIWTLESRHGSTSLSGAPEFCRVLPAEYNKYGDSVEAYRRYYHDLFKDIAVWNSYRSPPWWWNWMAKGIE